MAKYLMGIDYGTGGAKACLTTEELDVLAYSFREYPIICEKPGWSEHDPIKYWDVACDIIRDCISKAGIDAKEISAVSVSGAMPAMVMLDKDGNPINNAYNLMDRRAYKEVEYLKNAFGEKALFELNGNRLEDHPAVVNLMWEKANRPDSYNKIAKALTMHGFVNYKLTGTFSMTRSCAPFFGVAYDIRKNSFDTKMLHEIGIDPDIIPPIKYCDEVVGQVTETAAKQTGLASGTPVTAGQADCNAGWTGAGASNIGDIQMNLGTCGNFGVIHKDTDFLDSMINFAYTTHDTFITVPTTTTGGMTIRYLRDNFSPLEKAVEAISGIDAYDILNKEAEKIPAGSDGLVALPYLMGERTPIWDINARGVVFGLSLIHSKAHLVRAMMEAVGYALYDSFVTMKDKYQINSPIVLNEGGAKSKLWRRIITDIFNVPTVLVKNRYGAPYGDALLSGVAMGIIPSFDYAKQKAEYTDLMEPSKEKHELYSQYFGLYKKLYSHLKEDFVELANLRERSI